QRSVGPGGRRGRRAPQRRHEDQSGKPAGHGSRHGPHCTVADGHQTRKTTRTMAEIVAALATSHAPLITGRPEVSMPERRDRLYGGFHELHRRLTAARPDLIVLFVNDHIQNFPYSNMPAFCIGLAEAYDAPSPGGARLVRIPARRVRGAPGGGMALHEVGAFVGTFIRSRPTRERVALLATGGISHWVGTPETGRINPEFDRRVLDHVARADIEPLVRLTHAEIERDGGNGGQEIRNWVALLGAVPGWKGEVLAYEPVAEWITGCATVWVHP